MIQHPAQTLTRRAGRPSNVNGRDPKYLIRFFYVLQAFQRARESEFKYDFALETAQQILWDEYSIRASQTEIKRVLAASHDSAGQVEFAVRPYRDPEGRVGMALYEREKILYPHPSVRKKARRTT